MGVTADFVSRDNTGRRGVTEASQDFAASIRTAEPVLTMSRPAKKSSAIIELLKKNLTQNLAGAVLIGAVLSLFCMAQETPGLIPFMLPGAVLFIGLSVAEDLKSPKLKLIISAAVFAALAVVLIIWRGRIGGGLAVMMNTFYDFAESAQAYLYSRFPESESASPRIAAVWASCLIGLIMALPPERARSASGILLALIAMFLTAYYGMIPSWACIAVMLAALVLMISRGSVLSALPLLLGALLIFGAVMLIDPGESYGISRMDENFRDRFAFNSSLIQKPDESTPENNTIDSIDESGQTQNEDNNVFDSENGLYALIGSLAAVAALIAAAVYLIRRYLKKKQAAVRAGIDSSDHRTAVTAMFPYSVRWLMACGIDSGRGGEAPFSAMTGPLRGELGSEYGNRFGSMYELWKEAAYSDHPVSEGSRKSMEDFMKETIKISKNKCSFKDKLKIMFRYAL